MVLTKRKPSAEEREAALLAEKRARAQELLGDILNLRDRIEQFISDRTLEVKQTRDGAGLPLPVLRASLTANETCLCRCAARLLGDADA